MGLLAACAPAFAAEVETVVSEVIFAEPDLRNGGRTYGSISAFPLWGAIVVNPSMTVDDLGCISVLVHETTHMILFAHGVDEPLVLNPVIDRFRSPLRDDRRPMDGIFHAVCVVARLHAALSACAESGRLSRSAEADCQRRLDELAGRLDQGMAVVRKHAELSSKGRQVFGAIEAYVTEIASGQCAH